MLNSCDTEILDAMTKSMSYRMIKRIMKSSNIQKKHITACVNEFILEAENVGKYSLGIRSLNINIKINLLYSEKSIVVNWALIEGRQRCWRHTEKKKIIHPLLFE